MNIHEFAKIHRVRDTPTFVRASTTLSRWRVPLPPNTLSVLPYLYPPPHQHPRHYLYPHISPRSRLQCLNNLCPCLHNKEGDLAATPIDEVPPRSRSSSRSPHRGSPISRLPSRTSRSPESARSRYQSPPRRVGHLRQGSEGEKTHPQTLWGRNHRTKVMYGD